MAILRPIEVVEISTVPIKVGKTLEARLKAVRDAARARSLEFPLNEHLAAALEKAVTAAEKELGIIPPQAAAPSATARRRGRPPAPPAAAAE